MTAFRTSAGFIPEVRRFIQDADTLASSVIEERFKSLALALFALQFEAVLPFRRLCEARGITPSSIRTWTEIPAMPTQAFKEFEVTALPPQQRAVVFNSSGTTAQTPSRHFHSFDTLALYEASLRPWFEKHLLGDWPDLADEGLVGPLEKPGFLILAPPAPMVPNSSLVHMFETIRRDLGATDSLFAGDLAPDGSWRVDIDRVLFALRKSMCANRPVVILGTAFSFVHLLEHFEANNIRYRLAAGSRVMETGGYKGRSRALPKPELHALLTKRLGIPASHIVCEYGMSELSSQAYDHAIRLAAAGQPPARLFHFPPWARVQIVSPETGEPVADGAAGLVRVWDLANVGSALAVQTEDLAVRRGSGFELLGRASFAEPRGCSLMASE